MKTLHKVTLLLGLWSTTVTALALPIAIEGEFSQREHGHGAIEVLYKATADFYYGLAYGLQTGLQQSGETREFHDFCNIEFSAYKYSRFNDDFFTRAAVGFGVQDSVNTSDTKEQLRYVSIAYGFGRTFDNLDVLMDVGVLVNNGESGREIGSVPVDPIRIFPRLGWTWHLDR